MHPNPTRRARRAAAGLLLSALALAGCSAEDSSSAAAPMAVPGQQGDNAGTGRGEKAAVPPGEGQSQGQGQVPVPATERKLVRTASLDLESPDVPAASAKVRAAALSAGGFSGDERVDATSASLTLRVPSDKLDSVLASLTDGGAGTVRSRAATAKDVTEQTVDLDSRIKTQRASLDRVRALLANATSISDIVQVESEVTRREAELESLLARREALATSVELSTVTVRVFAPGKEPVPVEDEDGFLGALQAGWAALLFGGKLLLQVVGFFLPFAVPAAVVVWLVVLFRRRFPAKGRAAQVGPPAFWAGGAPGAGGPGVAGASGAGGPGAVGVGGAGTDGPGFAGAAEPGVGGSGAAGAGAFGAGGASGGTGAAGAPAPGPGAGAAGAPGVGAAGAAEGGVPGGGVPGGGDVPAEAGDRPAQADLPKKGEK